MISVQMELSSSCLFFIIISPVFLCKSLCLALRVRECYRSIINSVNNLMTEQHELVLSLSHDLGRN